MEAILNNIDLHTSLLKSIADLPSVQLLVKSSNLITVYTLSKSDLSAIHSINLSDYTSGLLQKINLLCLEFKAEVMANKSSVTPASISRFRNLLAQRDETLSLIGSTYHRHFELTPYPMSGPKLAFIMMNLKEKNKWLDELD